MKKKTFKESNIALGRLISEGVPNLFMFLK